MASRGRRINSSLREARCVEGHYTLRCHKCDSFAAQSEDIRKIEDSHHVIIDPAYEERIKIRPHPAPKKFVNFELTGKIYCKHCHWDWGVMAMYKKVPFPGGRSCSSNLLTVALKVGNNSNDNLISRLIMMSSLTDKASCHN